MLFERWDQLAEQRADFAVETTLASRSLAPRIARLQASGYQFHLLFFWLPNADLAVARVAERVRQGGHNIPENTIRRRYGRGLRNLFEIYYRLADTWRIIDNTRAGKMRLVATGSKERTERVHQPKIWRQIRKQHEENTY